MVLISRRFMLAFCVGRTSPCQLTRNQTCTMTHPTRGPQDHHIAMQSRIQAALQAQGFQAQKQPHQPGWVISHGNAQYRLSASPTPPHHWTLHPIDDSPTRQHIITTIRTALHPTAIAADQRPWAIVLIQSTLQRHTVARFRNRQDADDHLRAIRRYMPRTRFEILFEPPHANEA